jgi:hypothetical protein
VISEVFESPYEMLMLEDAKALSTDYYAANLFALTFFPGKGSPEKK